MDKQSQIHRILKLVRVSNNLQETIEMLKSLENTTGIDQLEVVTKI